MATTIPFVAYEISGLAQNYYYSAATNKKYVDTISGALSTRVNAAAGGGILASAFQTLTASTGIHPFTSTVKISGASAQNLVIDGYTTISSNAKKGQASAQTAILDADFGTNGIMTRTGAGTYSYLTDNSAQWNAIVGSGNEYSSMYASGAKFHQAYLSGQLAHTKVTLAGTPDYLTIADQVITRTKLDITDDTNFIAGTGVTLATNTVSVTGYSTISSQAKSAQQHLLDSGSKYHKAYLSGTTGVFQLHNATLDAVAASNYTGDDAITTVGIIGAGTWQGTTVKYAYLDGTAIPNISSNAKTSYNWFVASAQKLSAADLNQNKAYASAQALKIHAFHAKISSSYLAANYGWLSITSGSIRKAHSLSGTPNMVSITPSGPITFAYSVYNINSTDFTVSITAAGSRVVKWFAQI
jgi:hypothetical protein